MYHTIQDYPLKWIFNPDKLPLWFQLEVKRGLIKSKEVHGHTRYYIDKHIAPATLSGRADSNLPIYFETGDLIIYFAMAKSIKHIDKDTPTTNNFL
jgi:hypothetical protein